MNWYIKEKTVWRKWDVEWYNQSKIMNGEFFFFFCSFILYNAHENIGNFVFKELSKLFLPTVWCKMERLNSKSAAPCILCNDRGNVFVTISI